MHARERKIAIHASYDLLTVNALPVHIKDVATIRPDGDIIRKTPLIGRRKIEHHASPGPGGKELGVGAGRGEQIPVRKATKRKGNVFEYEKAKHHCWQCDCHTASATTDEVYKAISSHG